MEGTGCPIATLFREELELQRAGILRFALRTSRLPTRLEECERDTPRLEEYLDWKLNSEVNRCLATFSRVACHWPLFGALNEPWYFPAVPTELDDLAIRTELQRQRTVATSYGIPTERPPFGLSALGLPILYERDVSWFARRRGSWLSAKEPWLPSVREFLESHGGVPPLPGTAFYLDDVGHWSQWNNQSSANSKSRWLAYYQVGGVVVLCLAAGVVLRETRKTHLRKTLIWGGVAAALTGLLLSALKAPTVETLKVVDVQTASLNITNRLQMLDEALNHGVIDKQQASIARSWLTRGTSTVAHQ